MKKTSKIRSQNSVRRAMTRLACVAWLALGVGSAQGANMSWTNSAGGNYTNAANWSGGLPGAADNANFNLNSAYTINLTGNLTNNFLGFGAANGTATFNFNSNSLTLIAAFDGYNRFMWDLSLYGGTNTVNLNNGTLVLPVGTSRIAGPNGVATVNCSNMTFVGDSFGVATVNGGWVGNGTWNLYNSTATLTNFGVANTGSRASLNGSGDVLVGPGSVLNVVNGFWVGAYGSSVVGTITVSNGTFHANGGLTLGYAGTNAIGNLIVQGNGTVYANGAQLGYADNALGNIIIQDHGRVYMNGTVVFGNYGSVAHGNIQVNGPHALLEVNTITFSTSTPSTISINGGIFQFTNATPTFTSLTLGQISASNCTLSFRGITNADVTCIKNGKPFSRTRIAYDGLSTFRLDHAMTKASGGSQNAYFTAYGDAAYFGRLELLNGSVYRNGSPTFDVDQDASLYVSGGASTITGDLQALDSTILEFDLTNTNAPGCLLLTSTATISNCTLQLDFANPPIVDTPFLIISNTMADASSYSFADNGTRQYVTINGTNYMTTLTVANGGTEVWVQTKIQSQGTAMVLR